MSHSAIVIGAGSTIAQSIIKALQARSDISEIVAISRHTHLTGDKITSLQCDYQDQHIADLCQSLNLEPPVSHAFICNGVLHDEHKMPEKKIEDIDGTELLNTLHSNTVVPTLWLKHLTPLLKSSMPCKIAIFSARIGSISDNHLGGWYSYRASKAALNMVVQTASVEFARRAKNIKLLAFHPGTTDTPLSKPFQSSVPGGKLFTPEFVACQLLSLMATLEPDGKASYMDWNHTIIEW